MHNLRKSAAGAVALTSVVLLLCGCRAQPVTNTDALVITNANIYTVNEERPRAQAVAIDGNGVILAVGTTQDVLAKAGANVAVVDLHGQMLLPGFHDIHLHAVEAGINAGQCELPQTATAKAYRTLIRECADDWGDDAPWVLGSGVNMAELVETIDNPLALIDEVIADRPVLILDDIGHGAWVNSAALAEVGYTNLAVDPPGGLILRDATSGAPIGVVLENAQQVFRNAAFKPTEANVELAYNSLLDALDTLAQNGITSVSDAGGYWPQGHHLAWQRAQNNGTLTVRASNALYEYPELPYAEQLAQLKSLYSNETDSLLKFNHAKIYVDGILTQASGALYAPYEAALELDEEAAFGFTYFEQATLLRYARDLSNAGFQLHFHATGDRGAALALDAIAEADTSAGPHRVTHLYLVDPQDMSRFAQLGAGADLQVAPSAVDPLYLEDLSEFVGDRADHVMPLGSLHAAGATVSLSSDWDADELSPLIKLQTVLTRDFERAPSLAAAIRMMTLNAAKLLAHDDRAGSIEVGKYADLVVIDKDLFALPHDQLGTARVRATLLQGEVIYDADALFK